MLFVVRCPLFGVCWLLCVTCCLFVVDGAFDDGSFLFVAGWCLDFCCVLVCCSSCALWRYLCVVCSLRRCCLLFDISWCVTCCALFVVSC